MSIECFVGNSEKQGRLLIQGVDPTGLEEHSYMNKNGYWTTEQVFYKVFIGKITQALANIVNSADATQQNANYSKLQWFLKVAEINTRERLGALD